MMSIRMSLLKYGVDSQCDQFSKETFSADQGKSVPVLIEFDYHRVVGRATLQVEEEGLFADMVIEKNYSIALGVYRSASISFSVFDSETSQGIRKINKGQIHAIGLVPTEMKVE